MGLLVNIFFCQARLVLFLSAESALQSHSQQKKVDKLKLLKYALKQFFFFLHRSFAMPLQEKERASLFLISRLLTDWLLQPQ